MPTTTVLLIILALFVALALAAFQYFYKAKGGRVQNSIFTLLRFISLFSVLLLLINPKIRNVEYFTEKPRLLVAVDNSASIAHLENAGRVRDFVSSITDDQELKERFDVQVFGFGKDVTKDPELLFTDQQSNIPRVFKELRDLYENSRAPTILISDGNQTLGEEFVYSAAGYPQPVHPVVVGDTSAFRDLLVTGLNTNKYAFFKNKFPVEVMLSYVGKGAVDSRLKISRNGQTLFSREISFNEMDNASVIATDLPASAVGVQKYTVEIQPFSEEENTLNNSKQFAIEVVDERTKILLLYDILHPDLGALKKSIETNEQREVILQKIGEEQVRLDDYQLIILYQPNSRFSAIMGSIREKGKNLWIITGPDTDWRMLNEGQKVLKQEITRQTEEFQPVYNSNFGLFQNEDIGFSNFPPLTGSFGELRIIRDLNILLFRQQQGIKTTEPLWAISEEEGLKSAFLLGSGLWQWRSHVFREQESFEPFDRFIGKVVQFLTSGKRKDRLVISYEPLYHSNQDIKIKAEFFDRNYVFDPDAEIILEIMDEASGKVRQIPFLLRNSHYEVNPGALSPGEYSFTVIVSGESLARAGSFSLSSFDVEKQFSRANLVAMRSLAEDEGGQVYFLDNSEKLKTQLLNTNSYLPVQKSRENTVPLIDWYYLLGIIIISLGAEWFLRKYYGYI